jgi:hypothetical protein
MRITDAAGHHCADNDEIGIRSGADLKPCGMAPAMRFPEWEING